MLCLSRETPRAFRLCTLITILYCIIWDYSTFRTLINFSLMNILRAILSLTALLLLTRCTVAEIQSNAKPVDHSLWTNLLKKHVDSKGMVDYRGFIADSTALNHYLDTLSSHHPNNENWTKNERLAYWINAYNAFTIRLIIRHYPVASIKDIAGVISFVNSPWDLKFIQIEGETYDLNNIEHDIIRPRFSEPRIHFALVCAAVSCPRLQTEAFVAERLDSQLESAAKAFFNDPEKNRITTEKADLSKLMSWYSSDFTDEASSVREYVNGYSDVKITDDTIIDYLDYKWGLNAQ